MRIGPLKLKIQLQCGDEFAMGPGKADVLAAIDRAGSISAAGRELGMSYRRTWLLVDAMNRCFAARLVDTILGGGPERGARLTDNGRRVLASYRAVEAAAAAACAGADLDELRSLLRADPVPPG